MGLLRPIIFHYRTSKAIRLELQALSLANPDFRPAWPAAVSPVLRKPPDPGDEIWIDAAEAAAMLDFACAAYGLLLRFLVQSFGRRGATAATAQKEMFSTAMALMHVVSEACTALVRLPASDDVPGVNAGMSFTMLRGVEPLLAGSSEAALLKEQLLAVAAGGSALKLASCAQLAEMAHRMSSSHRLAL